ncbi:ABC transporter ATP-binding protein [Sphingomonas ginkgonis]|uniref:ABC transporter ATP-binding protein n=1 Tax=Sphingomonas ginkgonis TaxID=2315330 RepID=A0A3R9WTF0_9SPHN|nr:ABC transporter ATP-binding protein [Sphingomonas ginkgonis]RST31396.1 ABC transporter ATP-binding protein [Sphingomonas ginkgonis]
MGGRISVANAGKRFRRYGQGQSSTLKQSMMGGFRSNRSDERFWALRNIDLEVAPGTMLGVVGHNGSGKSTLLRLLGGVLHPDEGRVVTHGHVTGLLDLNAGMHSDLSGRENLMIGGVVAGLSRREVLARFDEIVAFAELENFIDNPFRTYSAGMKLRLGFAVAVHGRPDVLLIDELLSVGDGAFQAKCLRRIGGFLDEGAAIVLASHDLGQVTAMCREVLWLRRGEMVEHGEPKAVVGAYRVAMATQLLGEVQGHVDDRRTRGGTLLRSGENRFGSFEHEIVDVRILGGDGRDVEIIDTGASFAVEVSWRSHQADTPLLVVALGDGEGNKILDLNSAVDGFPAPAGPGLRRARLTVERLDVAAGDYFIDVGLYEAGWQHTYDYHRRVYPLQVSALRPTPGIVDPPRHWQIEKT